MAIVRTPWIDDDDSGTVGTVINNAEKQLLYDQIDATIVWTKIGSGSGQSTAAVAEVLSQFAFPMLTLADQVVVSFAALRSGGSGLMVVDLELVDGLGGSSVFTFTGAGGLADLQANGVLTARVGFRLGQLAGAGRYTSVEASGTQFVGYNQARGFAFGAALAVTVDHVGGQVLKLRQMSGNVGGSTLTWSWAVHLLKG